MARLIVNNFGPIKDLDLEIKNYMVFVGPQASGKSTISKLIYFFEKLWDDLSFPEDYIKKNFWAGNETLKSEREDAESFLMDVLHCNLSELKTHLFGTINNEYFLSYTFDKDYVIEITNIYLEENQTFYLRPTLSESLKDVLAQQESHLKNLYIPKEQYGWDVYNFKAVCGMSNLPLIPQIREIRFIPTGRSITTLLSNQLQNIELTQIDHLTRLFIQNIIYIRTFSLKGFKEIVDQTGGLLDRKLLLKTVNDIMKGDYIFELQNERIRVDDQTDVAIDFSSSGQQESLSIILTCLYHMWAGENTQLHIEEPEAHLYPSSQKSIIDLLSLFFNYNMNRVIITTHSPYILASINNLLYAHKVGLKQETAAHKIIDKNLWIEPKCLGAYKVTADGTVENIIDDELGIIKNESIDEIAQLINQQFDELFDLEN